MKKFLLIFLVFQFVLFIKVKCQNDAILYKDYRLFMIYTRDSIMRELLSTQLCDFSNYCELENNKKISPRLKWNIKINLQHEEILEILTNLENYGYYNFLEKFENKYYVNPKYLNYRLNRNDQDTINISIDLDNLKPIKDNLSISRFGLNNNCNREINDENIQSMLTQNQINAYNYWRNNIGLSKTYRITRKKVLF